MNGKEMKSIVPKASIALVCNSEKRVLGEKYAKLSYDVTSGSEIMSCFKIDKQLINHFWFIAHSVTYAKIKTFSHQNRDYKIILTLHDHMINII